MIREIKKQSQCHSLYAPRVFRPPIKQIQSSIQFLRSAIRKRQKVNNEIALHMFYSSSNQYQRMIAYKTQAIKTQTSTHSPLNKRSLHKRIKLNNLVQRMKERLVQHNLNESQDSRNFMDIKYSFQQNPSFHTRNSNQNSESSKFKQGKFFIKRKIRRKDRKIGPQKKFCHSDSPKKQNIQPKTKNNSARQKNGGKMFTRQQSVKGFAHKISAISGKIGVVNLDKSINEFLKIKFQQNIIVQQNC